MMKVRQTNVRFIGILRGRPAAPDEEQKTAFKQQNNLMTHRGPDDEGYYHDAYVSFGFRRLSIIDIDSGQQPLSCDSETIWLLFNGEIYNYVELRDELAAEGYQLKQNQTRRLSPRYLKIQGKGIEHLRGMFSILLWDKEQETLYGARDPFGIKPLFYRETDEGTAFASEKKSISLMMENEAVNTEALQHYLSFQFVPEPMTMTTGIQKVEPGHYFVQNRAKRSLSTVIGMRNFTLY